MKAYVKSLGAGLAVLLAALSVRADKIPIVTVFANSEQVVAGNNNPATNVKDGDLATRWAAGSGSFPQWILLDLGARAKIDSTRIAFYDPAGRTYTYSIAISPDDISYTVVVPDKSSGTTQFTKDSLGTTTRYIMITLSAVSNGTGFASIYEVEVHGSIPTRAGIIPVANVFANSEQVDSNNNNSATNVKDGDLATRWAAGRGSYPQWILLDLGARAKIDSTRIAFYDPAGRTYTYSIAISPDDISYTVVVPDKSSGTTQFTKDSLGTTTRYIMITLSAVSNGTGFASIYEVEVYGSILVPVAQKSIRPASPGGGNGTLVRPIDGHTLMVGYRNEPYDIGVYSLDGRCILRVKGCQPRAVTLPGGIHSGLYFVNGTLGGVPQPSKATFLHW